jgi:hypothetical protein
VTVVDAKPQTAMTNIILKTADPMTPLTPISSLAKKTPITTVANSGAELPAAIKVAPATSGLTLSSKKINFKIMKIIIDLYLYYMEILIDWKAIKIFCI